jgi:HlyD family secretion protein
MIKNAVARHALRHVMATAALLAAAGCRSAAPAFEPQGIVEYDEHVVAFETTGSVERVPIHRGDRLKKGDVLAQVDPTLERIERDTRADELTGARADLALLEAGSRREDIAAEAAQLHAAEASLSLAQTQRDRTAALRASQALPQSELDRAEADLSRAKHERDSLAERVTGLRRGARTEEVARARARVAAAESTLALAEARLDKCVVHAGTDGVVTDVHVETGELAAPGVPVATIADVGHPYVEVFVPVGDLDAIVVGTKAQVRVDASPAARAAVVEYVSPRAEFTPRFVFSDRERPNLVIRIRLRVDDPDGHLHAGVPAFARFQR